MPESLLSQALQSALEVELQRRMTFDDIETAKSRLEFLEPFIRPTSTSLGSRIPRTTIRLFDWRDFPAPQWENLQDIHHAYSVLSELDSTMRASIGAAFMVEIPVDAESLKHTKLDQLSQEQIIQRVLDNLEKLASSYVSAYASRIVRILRTLRKRAVSIDPLENKLYIPLASGSGPNLERPINLGRDLLRSLGFSKTDDKIFVKLLSIRIKRSSETLISKKGPPMYRFRKTLGLPRGHEAYGVSEEEKKHMYRAIRGFKTERGDALEKWKKEQAARFGVSPEILAQRKTLRRQTEALKIAARSISALVEEAKTITEDLQAKSSKELESDWFADWSAGKSGVSERPVFKLSLEKSVVGPAVVFGIAKSKHPFTKDRYHLIFTAYSPEAWTILGARVSSDKEWVDTWFNKMSQADYKRELLVTLRSYNDWLKSRGRSWKHQLALYAQEMATDIGRDVILFYTLWVDAISALFNESERKSVGIDIDDLKSTRYYQPMEVKGKN